MSHHKETSTSVLWNKLYIVLKKICNSVPIHNKIWNDDFQRVGTKFQKNVEGQVDYGSYIFYYTINSAICPKTKWLRHYSRLGGGEAINGEKTFCHPSQLIELTGEWDRYWAKIFQQEAEVIY